MNQSLRIAGLLGIALIFLLTFCQKERFTTDTADKLEFSTDTLRFDTVFTQLGSATRILKLYNRHKESIRISRIYLANGSNSRFHLNIDGLPGGDQRDIEIAPQDSLYVFAEVTVNPNQPVTASPFVLDEQLVFETNSNVQQVTLEAFGQNANYLPSRFGAGGAAAYQCTNGEEILWDDSLPYVIYGILVIDGCTLRIPAGTHVYVHGGLAKVTTDTGSFRYNDGYITFTHGGRLLVEGTQERPVIFEGDRLESEFNDGAGQWVGLWLQDSTAGHRLDHCIIRNSIIGLRVDPKVDVQMRNVQIYNTSNSGLIAYQAIIDAENCLFYNNAAFCIQLEWGGTYDFKYCTAANYGSADGEALGMTNVLCLNADCSERDIQPLKARFRNCIFYGSKADQITLADYSDDDPTQFDYQLENCIVRVKDILKPNGYPDFLEHCQPCINATSQDTIFLDPNREEYHLDSLHSIANRYAVPLPNIDKDLDGKMRDAVMPDAGAYEIEF